MDPQLRLLLEGVYQATESGKLAIQVLDALFWPELTQSQRDFPSRSFPVRTPPYTRQLLAETTPRC
jgi:hypothetical protein